MWVSAKIDLSGGACTLCLPAVPVESAVPCSFLGNTGRTQAFDPTTNRGCSKATRWTAEFRFAACTVCLPARQPILPPPVRSLGTEDERSPSSQLQIRNLFCGRVRGVSTALVPSGPAKHLQLGRGPSCIAVTRFSAPRLLASRGSCAAQLANGLGRIWKCTILGVVPLPPSRWKGVRLPVFDHTPRPFQPALGSSMRPSSALAQNPMG